jgi:hypothetical protein
VQTWATFKGKPVKSLLILRILLATALCAAPRGAVAADQKYDVLARMLTPFGQLFNRKAKNPQRAVVIQGRLEKMPGLPPERVGARATLEWEMPDKLLLRVPLFGEEFTICRVGQEIWVAPGSKLAGLLETAGNAGRLPAPDPKYRLKPFHLPIPEKQLPMLPLLFRVSDVGEQEVDGALCRVLDLQFQPELAKPLGLSPWTARVWVRPDSRPARLSLTQPGSEIVLRVDDVKWLPTLPAETWDPAAAGLTDVLKIDPSQYQQLLRLLGNVRKGA